jgi:hypothetical protein
VSTPDGGKIQHDPTISTLFKLAGKSKANIMEAVSTAIDLTVTRHEANMDAETKKTYTSPKPADITKVVKDIATLLWESDKPLMVVTPTDIPRYLKVKNAGNSLIIKRSADTTPSSDLYTAIAKKNRGDVRIKFDGEVHHIIPLYLGGSHALSNLISVFGQAKGEIADSAHAQLHDMIDNLGNVKLFFESEGKEQSVDVDSLKPEEIYSKFKDKLDPVGNSQITVVVGTLYEGGDIQYEQKSFTPKKK